MTRTDPRILIVDDNEDVLLAASMLLRNHKMQVVTEKSPDHILRLLQKNHFDVVLLDMNFRSAVNSGNEGFYWLRQIREQQPETEVILITAYGDVELAVRSLKEGASDFVLKPWQNEKLIATVESAVKLGRSRSAINGLQAHNRLLEDDINRNFSGFVGKSPTLQQVFTMIEKVSRTDANVLILGENGTGKELVARALHRKSLRHDKAFVHVDVGAITETLFESELFGHVKGAFTDAREDKAGRFELANGGTLFLDEIGNLSVPVQSKLLAALQNREIYRVGSGKAIPVDIRLVCATNADLNQQVKEKKFRQDLLYRINTVEICLPPLRERREDIPLLVEHFKKLYSRKYFKDLKPVSSQLMKELEMYNWPGNVRELQHAVERAVILCDGNELRTSDFFMRKTEAEALPDTTNLDDMERMIIRRVLEKHGGNITRASRELGLTRASLYRRLEKHGI